MSWRHETGIGRNNFDFVRFILAVAVILSHSYAMLQGPGAEPGMHITRRQMNLGDLAVDWFFVISGFLIAHSWLRSRSTLEYLKKRVLRIYPGFIGAVLFCTFVVAPLAVPSVREHLISGIHPLSVAGHTAILRYKEPAGAFPNNRSHAINGSLWSISYEFWCYIGVALLGILGLLKSRRAILASFIFVMLISLIFLIGDLRPGGGIVFRDVFGGPRLWSRMLPYYMAGVTFYLFRNSIPFSRLLAIGSALLLLLIPFWSWAAALIMPIAGTYILFWFAFEPRIRLENWARYGDFSYGIYVFAFPIQQLIIMKMGTHISPLLLFALATPVCIFAGAVSWWTIERRFLKLKKSHLLSPPPAPDVAAAAVPVSGS